MATILSRIIHYGFQNFWRNGWLSTATVAILLVVLFAFLNLNLFNVAMQKATQSIQDKIDISVYFKTNTPEDQILSIKQSTESLAEVKSVDYVSTDQALAAFRDKHQDDQVISQAINELNQNPFQASLNIKAKNPSQYASIAEYLSAPNLAQYIDSVSYAKNQIVIDRLAAIISNVNKGGLALTIILAIIAGLVAFNTIRLAIYSSREEIGIMRAVGASNAFVRGPYIVEGVLCGAIAALASFVFTAPALYFISPYLNSFVPGLNIFQYFYMHFLSLLAYELTFGVGIGVVSSFVAVRRYLKN